MPLPIIQLVEGELPRVIDEAEAALLADIGRQQLYQRGELVVRPARLKLRAADMQGHKRETSGPSHPSLQRRHRNRRARR